jgi:hypothetical protein
MPNQMVATEVSKEIWFWQDKSPNIAGIGHFTGSNQVYGRTLRVGEILRTGSCSAGKNLYKTVYGTSVRISCCTVIIIRQFNHEFRKKSRLKSSPKSVIKSNGVSNLKEHHNLINFKIGLI